MADPAGSIEFQPPAIEPGQQTPPPMRIWNRVKEHKVVQWALAYTASAYTLLHGAEMLSEAQEWPHIFVRVFSLLLLLGVPVVITLAWYHGAKALRRVSAPELTIITILLFIAGSILWAFTRTSGEHAAAQAAAANGPAPPVTAGTATPAAPRTSIAVMPFANLTGDASKDYLGDGMSEELINMLTKVSGLKVPARTSSFAYKGRNADVRQIARDLGVGTILEGSVRSAGDRLRVTAQLINAGDGLHIWSETYDRKFTDLFKLQDELANAIVHTLRLQLNPELPAADIGALPTHDVEAYQLYLQARSVSNSGTEQSLRQSLKLYEKALARDPGFARAYAGIANMRTTFVVVGLPLPGALEDAEREAERALALDPSLAPAEAVLGTVHAFRGNWLEAESRYRAAISRDPSDPRIHEGYSGDVLTSVGRLRASLSTSLEAYRLAPADPLASVMVATAHSLMGHDTDALKFADLAVALGISPDVTPMPQIYANAARRTGRHAEAADRAVLALSPSMHAAGGDAVMKSVFAAMGDAARRPGAVLALQQLLRRIPAGELEVTTRKDIIEAFTSLGALDAAFDFANQSLDEFARTRTVGSSWGVLWLPEMRAFRRDPRFAAFVARLGMPEYWKQYGPPDDCDLRDGRLTCR